MKNTLCTLIGQCRRACTRGVFTWLLPCVALLAVGQATAADREISGVKVAQSLKLGGENLELNGAGVRYRGPFKAYVAALYTSLKLGSAEELHASKGAKRLELTMLREVDSAQLGRLFVSGIQKNMAPGELSKVMVELPRMGEIFASHKRLLPADQLVIDWLPGQGMQITVKGEKQGGVFKSPAFFAALMNIWLGPSPADWQLKDALLAKTE